MARKEEDKWFKNNRTNTSSAGRYAPGAFVAPTELFPPTGPTPTLISLSVLDTVLAIGSTLTVAAVVRDQNNQIMAGRTPTWISSDEAVATVDSSGVVTAVGPGACEVRAVDGDTQSNALVVIVGATATLAIAKTSGDAQSATVGQALTNPFVVTVTADGSPVPDSLVSWAASDGTIVTSSVTNASGQASASFTCPTAAGAYSVIATCESGAAVTFSVTATAGAAANIVAISATNQSTTAGTAVTTKPSVLVTDTYGNPKSGVTVTFAAATGGGSGTTLTPSTGADGTATVGSWTLGASAGVNTMTATAAGLAGSPVTFTATGTVSGPGPITQITVNGGSGQTGIVAGQAAATLSWKVADASNVGIEGATVSYTVDAGGGSLSAATATTDASGIASVTLTTGTTVGVNTVTASVTDGTGATISSSISTTTTFGTATKLGMVSQPASNTVSGDILNGQPAVEVLDANDNRVTSATNTVSVAIHAGSNATISAGVTSVAAVSGVATFSGLAIADVDGGSSQLDFSATGLTGATSSAITVAPPVPFRLSIITQPGNGVAGAAGIGLSVGVYDDVGTLVVGSSATVTVALTTANGATLSGTTTVNAVSGIATFSNLSIDLANTYTLTVSSSGLLSATSNSITISASSGAYPNEPAGFTQITRRVWSSATENGWSTPSGGTLKNDGVGLPTGLSTYIRHQVPNNSTGTSLGTTEKVINTLGKTRLYASVKFKLSPNFQGHSSLTNKLGLWLPAGVSGNSFFLNMKGKDQNNLAAEAYFQSVPTALNGGVNSRRITNSAGMSLQNITRDVPHQWELDYTLNTYDVADGVLKMWFDGVMFINETNIGVRGTGGEANSPFWRVKWNPIWGGTGTPNTNVTQIDCYEIYVSG